MMTENIYLNTLIGLGVFVAIFVGCDLAYRAIRRVVGRVRKWKS